MKKFLSMIIFVLIMGIFTGCTDTEQARQPDESLLLDANVMTDYLCRSLNSKKSPEEADFNYLQFVFSCFYYKDQPDFCYYDATPLDKENDALIINLDASRKIMHQVFGIDWDITENVTGFSTKTEDNHLLFYLGFGWGLMGYAPGDYIYSEFDDNGHVVTHFDLDGPDWDADDIATKPYGRYTVIYDITNENGQEFLRFNRFEKE